ncbi:MAG: hypothetical protein GC157_07225 [Frankiales bacterium]|nr:hypothetical protein [Frankiales bacterium]
MISHPMRLDSAGAIVTIDDHSARAAAEMAGHVVSCLVGERALAPLYGIHEPVPGRLSVDVIAGAIAVCEPEITATRIEVAPADGGRVRVQVDVEWSQP